MSPTDDIFNIYLKHGKQILSIDNLRSHVSRGTLLWTCRGKLTPHPFILAKALLFCSGGVKGSQSRSTPYSNIQYTHWHPQLLTQNMIHFKIEFLKKVTSLLAVSHIPAGDERQSSVSMPWADKRCYFHQKWQWGSVVHLEATMWDCWGFMMSDIYKWLGKQRLIIPSASTRHSVTI